MKKLFAYSFLTSILCFGGYSAKADLDWDFWGIDGGGYRSLDDTALDRLLTINSATGESTVRYIFQNMNNGDYTISHIDEDTGNVFIKNRIKLFEYDLDNDTLTDKGTPWDDSYKSILERQEGVKRESDGSISVGLKDDTFITKNLDGSVQIGGDTDDIDIVSDGLNIDGGAVITKNTDGSVQIGGDTDDIDIVSDGLNIDGAAVITKNEDGSIQIGADGNDIDITSEGLTVDGVSLITKKDSGEIHIGKNSLITLEEDGVQKLYAKDSNDEAININVTNGSKLLINGTDVEQSISTNTSNIAINSSNIKSISSLISKSTDGVTSIGENSLKLQETSGSQKMWATNSNGDIAPIDITNGTKLLINGRDVEQSIDNVGALNAALTGLPTIPQDSHLSCGIGVGVHRGSNAFAGGCATRVNDRLSFNAAASFIPAKQEYQGNDNSWSGRAGFVFKLGKINNPSLISMKEKKNLQAKITELSTSNKKIQAQNKNLQAKVNSFESKNQELIKLLAMQNDRLEKIEQIALANHKYQKKASSLFSLSNFFLTIKGYFLVSK